MLSPPSAWLYSPPDQSFAVQLGYSFTPLQLLLPVELELDDELLLELDDELLLELDDELLLLDEELDDPELPLIEPVEGVRVTLSSLEPSSRRCIHRVCEPEETLLKVVGLRVPQPLVEVLF